MTSKEKAEDLLYEITLRDYFAAKILQGHLASEYYVIDCDKESLAENIYKFADVMIEERNKNK